MCFEELIDKYRKLNTRLEKLISDPNHQTSDTIHSLDIEINKLLEEILHIKPNDECRLTRINFCLEILKRQYLYDGQKNNNFLDSIRSDSDFLLKKLQTISNDK